MFDKYVLTTIGSFQFLNVFTPNFDRIFKFNILNVYYYKYYRNSD